MSEFLHAPGPGCGFPLESSVESLAAARKELLFHFAKKDNWDFVRLFLSHDRLTLLKDPLIWLRDLLGAHDRGSKAIVGGFVGKGKRLSLAMKRLMGDVITRLSHPHEDVLGTSRRKDIFAVDQRFVAISFIARRLRVDALAGIVKSPAHYPSIKWCAKQRCDVLMGN